MYFSPSDCTAKLPHVSYYLPVDQTGSASGGCNSTVYIPAEFRLNSKKVCNAVGRRFLRLDAARSDQSGATRSQMFTSYVIHYLLPPLVHSSLSAKDNNGRYVGASCLRTPHEKQAKVNLAQNRPQSYI